MALVKATELASGVTGDYWKIVRTDIVTYPQPRAVVVVSLFKDILARQEGKEPLLARAYEWHAGEEGYPFTIAAMDAESLFYLAYNALHAKPEFIGAINV